MLGFPGLQCRLKQMLLLALTVAEERASLATIRIVGIDGFVGGYDVV